ncbi:unnamed protein product [Rhizophagus irregularis]|nr:unnamed protein product [Rhizophagus irregularis]
MDPVDSFKLLLTETIEAREKNAERESSQSDPLEGLFNGIFDSPVKKLKKEKKCQINPEEGLELEQSDTITKLVTEFYRASSAVGNTGEIINYIVSLLGPSWQRIFLILSLFGALITDSPTTYGLLLGLGGDISNPSSVLQPALSVPIPAIFEYLTAQLNISCQELWNGILSFMIIIIRQYPHAMIEISYLATEIIKNILKQIESLKDNLTKTELDCVKKGKEVIDIFLNGKDCGGVGCVSHYQIIEQIQELYGPPVRGQFIKVHWTLENFINELSQRRRRLAFLMIPPDAAWPLVSHYSRSHEHIDFSKLGGYQLFQYDYEQFTKEGQATSHFSKFRDMFFQRAPIEEVEAMIKDVKLTSVGLEPMCAAFFTKVHDVIKLVQSHPNFSELRRDLESSSDEIKDTLIPENLDFWELIIELGDQLYGLVASEYIKYEEVLQEFHHMVYPKSGENFINRQNTLSKDNTLIWLLLQLFHIERIGTEIITKDLANDERLFSMLIQLYNDQQIMSVDAFYLRDLSLQCVIGHQGHAIRDRNNLKSRYPRLSGVLAHYQSLRRLQPYFQNVYKNNVTTHDLFKDLPIQETIKIAIISQLTQNLVADTLYVHSVPDKLMDVGILGFPEAKFAQGGNVTYKLCDFINIHNKHRLEQLIYKMMLGDKITFNYPAEDQKITCVSPYTLDVVYKIVYSAPWSLELMVKTILEKFKKVDKLLKSHAENNLKTEALPEQSLRWQHTILQLFCHRFLRFLKYSSKAPDLLHYIKHSVSYLDHRQTYRDAEMFAIHIMMIQTDIKFIKSIEDPKRDNPTWFPESELLARYMIFTLARLIKFRGLDNMKLEIIQELLRNIYVQPLEWSVTTLNYFPEPLYSFFLQQEESAKIPSVSDKDINAVLSIGNLFKLVMDEKLASEDEASLQEYYSKLENQSIFLCSLWKIGCYSKSLNPDMMSTLRKVLLQFPPSRMATYTTVLIDFIIEKIDNDSSSPSIEVCYKMLEELIWRYQILAFEHVLFALIRGQREKNATAFKILDFLLFKSEEYSGRVNYFISLGFTHRYWIEDDHHDKLMKYLERYPEYFQYEAYAIGGYDEYETVAKKLDPPLTATNMPIYYTSAIRKSLPILDLVIGRLIEFSETEMLTRLLDEYGQIYKFHQTPLSFVRDLLCYYYPAPTLRDSTICSKLIKLLDFDEYDFATELLNYGTNEILFSGLFDSSYFEKVFHKLANHMEPQKCAPKTNTKLPERHFQEIPNPVVRALHIACVEVLATPVSSQDIVKSTLDVILMNGRKNTAVQPIVLHAMGLLYSFLPTKEFVDKMFDEMLVLIQTDPHLAEFSQPCNISGCGPLFSRTYSNRSHLQSMDPFQQLLSSNSEQPFSTMFPYIFNDYRSNLRNFGTNAANSFLTFIHSLLHYSNIEIVQDFLDKFVMLNGIKTDIQLLYLCALVGPLIYRFEHNFLFIQSFLRTFIQHLQYVTLNMKLEECGDSTLALEQIYDFLHCIKTITEMSCILYNYLFFFIIKNYKAN